MHGQVVYLGGFLVGSTPFPRWPRKNGLPDSKREVAVFRLQRQSIDKTQGPSRVRR